LRFENGDIIPNVESYFNLYYWVKIKYALL
jgi:hypothetical protein